MAKYKVLWNYRSSLGGPWMKGDLIDLADLQAEAINRDSPGVLKPMKSATTQPRMVTDGEERSADPDDRMGGANDQGAIDKTSYRAVRDG